MFRRVLIVVKCHSLADRLALLLEHLGHQVRIARDQQAALVVAQNFHPEAALIDRTMRDVEGIPIAVGLCSVAGCEHIRIIAIDASDRTGQGTYGLVAYG